MPAGAYCQSCVEQRSKFIAGNARIRLGLWSRMSAPDRQELLRNAAAFLADPKVLLLLYSGCLAYTPQVAGSSSFSARAVSRSKRPNASGN